MLSGSTSLPTVIFVHGLRTSGALWDEQIRALTAAGYPSMAVDLPGHGIRRGERFTMSGALQAIDSATAEAPTQQFVLVGLSLGGYTVLHYAAARSRATDSRNAQGLGAHGGDSANCGDSANGAEDTDAPGELIGVLAAACSSDPSTKPLRAYRDVAARVVASNDRVREVLRKVQWPWTRLAARAHGSDNVTTRMSGARRGTPAQQVGQAQKLQDAQEERLPWAVVTDALTALDTVSSVKDLMQIQAPVLLVNGQWDHLRLEERAYIAAAPRTKLIVIPGAKHDVSLEAPIQFNRVLLNFLNSLNSLSQPA